MKLKDMNMQARLELEADGLKELAEKLEANDFDLSDFTEELFDISDNLRSLSEDKFGRLQFNPSTGEEEK